MRNTFQYHSLKAVVCHNHSRLGGIALHVLHSFQCFQQMEQTVVGNDGNRLIRLLGVEVITISDPKPTTLSRTSCLKPITTATDTIMTASPMAMPSSGRQAWTPLFHPHCCDRCVWQ